ncbi:MAG: response regulator transcription factor [Alphaproteobacteria bacterium]|jgi:two-component system phosphate regulon response regulator OmpR|nr:response regulator transcription factor [Alphaproteobacteria bacterium]
MMDNIKDTEIQHILVIDDDERLRLLLRRFLEESGFRVTDVASARDARRLLGSIAFDLLIVDIMMPGETGLEFLTDLRKASEVPALFLTAMAETEHRITGLESGADDYMSKPFEPRELVLRIRSILARAAARPRQAGSSIGFGPYSFDPSTGVLMHSSGRIHITTAEQKLLASFASHPDTVLSREDIATAMDSSMRGRSIDVAVARLRAKLEPDPRFPVYLQTVRNKGWLLRTDNPSGGINAAS